MYRRLAAILAADVVAYSRLMGEDEAGTLTALKARRRELIDPTIVQHHGRIVKLMGDGALVEFASVVEALQCAVDIQRSMAEANAALPKGQRIEFRIGITIGDIIVDGDDIYGNGVNVAARLEGLADPGGICISGRAFDQVEKNVSVGFDKLGPHRVKNIEKPVNVYRIRLDGKSAGKVIGLRLWSLSVWRWIAVAVVLLVFIGAAAWTSLTSSIPFISSLAPSQTSPVSITGRPFVAVLPFANLSGDAGQEHITDAITEDLISELGRFSSLAVLSPNAVFPYKDTKLGASEVGKRLQVRYLVQGSFRQADDHIRVSTWLTDTQRGELLWSGQFDDRLRDVFVLQQKIAQEVAGKLASNVRLIEARRIAAKPIDNLDVYDLVQRARAIIREGTRSSNHRARQLLTRAVKLDPRDASAHALLGRAYYDQATHGWTEFPQRSLERAKSFARQAIALDDTDVSGHRLLARIYVALTQYEKGLAEADRAIALNPSDAGSIGTRGYALLWAGQTAEAVEWLERQFVLDPTPHPTSYIGLALAYYLTKRLTDAAQLLEQASLQYPNYHYFLPLLAACYHRLNRPADAADAVARLAQANPYFIPENYGSRLQNPTDRAFVRDGLYGAGIRPPGYHPGSQREQLDGLSK